MEEITMSNGTVLTTKPEKPKTPAKPGASLSSVFAQATELAKLWETICPAARSLFLSSIEAIKKE